MDIVNLIVSLVSGAIGGNVAGATMSDKNNMGAIANTVAGLIGGGAGDFILKAMGVLGSAGAAGATGSPEMDISSLLATIGISGVSGGVITAIISMIKGAMQK